MVGSHTAMCVSLPAWGRPLQVFDEHMPGPNQLSKLREDVSVTAADLLAVPQVGRPRRCSRRGPGLSSRTTASDFLGQSGSFS